MGISDKRPLGTPGCVGIPNLFFKSAIPENNSGNDGVSRGPRGHKQRGGRVGRKTSNTICSTTTTQHRFLSTLFVVSKKGGGHRPIFNLKQLNHFVQYEHFKMEGMHMQRDLLKPNDYMAKIDLKDAYFTISIWKDHQKFLRFLWKDTQWEFMCLPFRLASAQCVFTKILKPIVGLLKKQGIRLIIYLDDILLMASTAETLSHHVTLTVALLGLLGFVANYKKSELNPVQSLEFLGFQINSVTFQSSLPKDKVKNIKRECQKVLDHQTITVRELARLLGKLSTSIQAVFPAPLHYRYHQAVKKQSLAKQWCYEAPVTWSATSLEELKW